MNPTDPNALVEQGNAQAEAREQALLSQNPITANAAPGSTTAQAQTALQQPTTPTQTPAPAGNQPGILERLLPTIGGVLGGLGAGAADLVTGGAAIPFDAAIAGAGSALGKAGENALTGQKVSNGVLGAGAEGALGQGVGEAGGALLGKAGSLASGLGEKMATNAADKAAQATTDAQGQTDAQAATDTTQAYKNNYGALSDRLQRDLKLGTNGKFVDSMGGDGSNPYDMQQTSQGGLELNSVYNDALEKAKPVDMSDFGNQVYKTMQQTGTTDLSTTPLGKALQDYGVAPNEPLPDSMPATDVRKLQQSVGTQIGNTQKLINNSELQGVSNTDAEGQLQTLNNVYKDLGAKIKTPQVDQAIASTNVDDDARAALQQKYGEQHGNYIADTVNNAKGADDLLKPMQSYSQMNQASKMAINDIENAPGTARALARTKADVAPAPQQSNGSALSGENLIKGGSLLEGTLGHHPLALAAPLVMKAAENPAVVGGVGSILSKLGASGIPGALGAAVGTSPNDVAGPAGIGNDIQLNGGAMNPAADETRNAIIAALYNYGNGGAAQLGGAIKANQQVGAAQAAEQNLASNFNAAGGAQGPVGGILDRLGATLTGGEAGQYQKQAGADQEAIARALGVPAAQVATPSINENQSAAQASLGNIQALIQALTQGTGSTGLVDATQQ